MFGCRHLPVQLPHDLVVQLAVAYGEPHRAYHNAAHIAALLDWFDRVGDDVGWQQPAEVYIAILFHDAIYEPGAKDNEARSAEWARKSSFSVDPAVDAMVSRARVTELIALTARHGHLTSADPEAALFLDCDMSIIGAPPAEFTAYDEAIRLEYHSVPSDAYRTGRRAFLAGLLAKPRIFLSEYFHSRLDAQARVNLTAALGT